MSDPTLRLVHPVPTGPISVAEAYPAPLGTADGRPWVAVCMVQSIDGSTVVAGRAKGLSSSTDLEVLLQLRDVADVIIVGAATVAAESYGPPRKPGQRIGVFTRRGNVDTSTELFSSGAGFLITSESAEIADPDIDVLRVGETSVDIARAVARLGEIVPGVASVQAEGGATINGELAAAGLIDEMNMTTSPRIVAGDGPRSVAHGPDVDQGYEPVQVAIDDDGFVYTRWRRTPR